MTNNNGYWIESHSFAIHGDAYRDFKTLSVQQLATMPIDEQIELWINFSKKGHTSYLHPDHTRRLGFIRTHASKYRFTKINAHILFNDVFVVDAFLNEQNTVLYKMKFNPNPQRLYSRVEEDNPYKFEHIDTIDNV